MLPVIECIANIHQCNFRPAATQNELAEAFVQTARLEICGHGVKVLKSIFGKIVLSSETTS